MTQAHSTDAIRVGKVQKPYPEFPLYAHASGRWCKKIRGKLVYFGHVRDGWEAALEAYTKQADDLHAGRRPRDAQSEGATIKDLCNAFWNAKKALVKSGELSPRTFIDYERITDLLISHFGRGRVIADFRADDFGELREKLTRRLGPVSLSKEIQMVRMVFKFAFDSDMIDRPVRFGPGFKRPSKKTMRLEKAKKGKQLFAEDEIHRMLGSWKLWLNKKEGKKLLPKSMPSPGKEWSGRDVEAGLAMKAMILLGINCGFGNADCGTLPRSAIDLELGWINYHRPKTGIDRRCPLWPETIEAIKAALANRPEAKDQADADLVFITKYGKRWAKDDKDNPVSKEMRKLLDELGIKRGRSFYTLRHTFQTIGDEAKDPVATRFIMGHADSSMSGVYREDVSDERLRAVTTHVQTWLFGEKEANNA